MARPREFDPEIALKGAMNVFWKHGYEDASLPALLKGMGLTRGSFYKAFTDKKSLFLSILHRYENEAVEPAVEMLTDKSIGNGILRIETLFNSIVESVEAGDRRGCLLCSTISAPVAFEKDVSKAVSAQLDRMREGFLTALHDSNCLNDEINRTAELLISQYVGMRILTRSGADVENLRASTQALITQLRSLSLELH